MNAAEQATNVELASKIATVVNLFKTEFPDAKSDLKPWKNDPETRELVDPDSIDIGFHFPGISKSWRSRSVLIQIRFYEDPITNVRRAIGIEASGFDHRGEVWRLSTIEKWSFVGESLPASSVAEKLKKICQQILEVFNNSCNLDPNVNE
ncbi:hypothetical protein B6N60_03255 [Richelia sinica FACHB-800]|uniref:Uncharacterized protein n=1 Tax=Richelia sinica FACHB-800 TaxID=1357546 RepID=A0A975T9F3_9NOST|nr:hypothetical protein [Richelia sinica]MBD2663373.1 hypothetical protein [Richelia sinica FACHB-800]QXE24550.1 hypothetical protein B6N60_03255 [Richelia sinica FACHB-800]